MNELQQVLLVFAIILVVGLYFFSRQRNPDQDKSADTLSSADDAVADDFAQPIDSAKKSSRRAVADETHANYKNEAKPEAIADEVPEAQAKLPFGEDFELEMQNYPVLEIEDMVPEGDQIALEKSSIKTPEPQVFAILVLTSAKEFSLSSVAQTLKASGLSYSDKGTFVKKTNGKIVLQVANVMEPGVFPAEPSDGETTPGVALILELPTAIKASEAMDDLIMTARRVSQRLKGRMYDMQRHLIRESDLQAMREAASDYHSKTL